MSPSQVFCGEPVGGTGCSWEVSRAASRRRPHYGFSVYSRQWEERNHTTHMEHKSNGTPDTGQTQCTVPQGLALQTDMQQTCPGASSPARAGTGPRMLSPIADIPCRGHRVRQWTKTLHNIKSRSSQFCKMGLGLGDQGDTQHCHAAIYSFVDMHLD